MTGISTQQNINLIGILISSSFEIYIFDVVMTNVYIRNGNGMHIIGMHIIKTPICSGEDDCILRHIMIIHVHELVQFWFNNEKIKAYTF